MTYTLNTLLANKENYGSYRNTSKIKYIVWHYTAGDGDSAPAIAKYFATKVSKTSAHYAVDDNSVYQCVPDNYIAYAVGGKKYNDCAKTGGGTLYGIACNTNTISIEICDTIRNGVYAPSEATLLNVIALTKVLMKKYNIHINQVIRHFDVNGKYCPAYYMDYNTWISVKNRILSTTENSIAKQENIASSSTKYSYDNFISDCKIIMGLSASATPEQVLAKSITISATKNKNHALVTPWERLLKSLGYYSGAIEADQGKLPTYGSGMTQAMKKFQTYVVKQTNVKYIDGEATAKGKSWKKALQLI